MAVNQRLIRKRIKSSKNIAQITKAMEMVAASKVKKAQAQAVSGKPYADLINSVVGDIARRLSPESHPLLKSFTTAQDLRFLVVLITTNKGLCGSLNTSLILALDRWVKAQKQKGVVASIDYVTVGKKGQRYVARSKMDYIADFSDYGSFVQALPPLGSLISDKFLSNSYDMVWVAYNEFITALRQEPMIRRILPISPSTEPELFGEKTEVEKVDSAELLIEPSPEEVLEAALPLYLQVQIRKAILEAEASEHSARMLAMKNATDNALSLIDGLTLEYNKARQQSITSEIADVETARMSVRT